MYPAAGNGPRRAIFSLGFGVVAGKLQADVAFYLPVIYTYERRKRRAVKAR
ncbi:MAG: hypothetical protein H0T50_15885 [Gemmatimonadales bacterium]|nr:hypothetical protein [Gemmatimonadales bacterium]